MRFVRMLMVAALLGGCISTPYKSMDVTVMTDAQLIEELDACAKGVGASIDRSQYLIATMPDPAYVMTSSSSYFTGTANTSFSAYAMPAGYGRRFSGTATSAISGMSTSTYQYTDANAMARGTYALAASIAASQAEAFRKRGLSVLEQIKTRIERRRAETQAVIDQFFSDHPDAAAKQHLIASVLPWVASSSDAASPRETLEEVRSIALSLPRGQGVSGIWHGTFSQVTTLPDGQKYSFNQFLRMALEQQGQSVKGIGEMGTGERLEVTGRVVDADFSGLVANTTSAINVKFTGSAADSQMVLSFSGAGLDQEVAGTATLFR